MSPQKAESLLEQEDKEGCFVVRNSSTTRLYSLSVYTKDPYAHVTHYRISQNTRGQFYLSGEDPCFNSIPDLVNYYRHNSGRLVGRLKTSPGDRPVQPAVRRSHNKWEIDRSELEVFKELGSGAFGIVHRGQWCGSIHVAVKKMRKGAMSEDEFIAEAEVMTKLKHQNLVQLYGICSKHRPIYIVTEYMEHGSLLDYLSRKKNFLRANVGRLLDICIQVCGGMAYLESKGCVHRDLAARNCLVGAKCVVKVADFGLARYVNRDLYVGNNASIFPRRSVPPEVLIDLKFSSKSDVWAYGILMWEIFTCGKVPYGELNNNEVEDCVKRGKILAKPQDCPREVDHLMKDCWSFFPKDRPSFHDLKEELTIVDQDLFD